MAIDSLRAGEAGSANAKRFQRLRWVVLGTVVGAGLTIAIGVVVSLLAGWRSVDATDAAKVAEKWAVAHRKPGENYQGRNCEMDAGGYRFACRVRFQPTGRTFTLFMRKEAPNGHYEVVISQVRRGIHPIPDFR